MNDKKYYHEFASKFMEAKKNTTLIVEFSLQDIQEYARQRSSYENMNEEETKNAIQVLANDYTHEMENLAKKIEISKKHKTLSEDEDIGITRYVYYHIRNGEANNISDKEMRTLMAEKPAEFDDLCEKEQQENENPFTDFTKNEDELEL